MGGEGTEKGGERKLDHASDGEATRRAATDMRLGEDGCRAVDCATRDAVLCLERKTSGGPVSFFDFFLTISRPTLSPFCCPLAAASVAESVHEARPALRLRTAWPARSTRDTYVGMPNEMQKAANTLPSSSFRALSALRLDLRAVLHDSIALWRGVRPCAADEFCQEERENTTQTLRVPSTPAQNNLGHVSLRLCLNAQTPSLPLCARPSRGGARRKRSPAQT